MLEMQIIGKGGKIRVIPIATEIQIFVKKMIKECPYEFKSDDFIFLGKKGGKLKKI